MDKKAEEEKTSGLVSIDDVLQDNPFFPSNKEEDPKEELKVIEEEDLDILAQSGKNNIVVEDEGEELSSINSSEKQKQPVVPSDISNTLKESLKKLGIEDFSRAKEDGELENVEIKDIEVTSDLFEQLLEARINSIKEEAEKNKISIENTSELTQKLIEIEKAGGNISDVLDKKQRILDPMQSFDLGNLEGQVAAITMFMQLSQKYDAEDIEARIKLYQDQGVLQEKAQEFQQKTEDFFKDYVESTKKEAETAKIKAEEDRKIYRKDFVEKGLSIFELNDVTKKKVADFATKVKEDSKTDMYHALGKALADPTKASKIALFLLDEEEFVKQISKVKVREQQVRSSIILGTVKDSKSKKSDEFNLGTSTDGGLIPIE